MKYMEKHPMLMIVMGVLGISLSFIFVKYSTAPSAVTAAFRLLWTVLFLTPVVLGKKEVRRELLQDAQKDGAAQHSQRIVICYCGGCCVLCCCVIV